MKRKIHQQTTAERPVPGGRELRLTLRADDLPAVPGTLLLPADATPAAGVLLLHGYGSRREHMAESVGFALLRGGAATLSLDLPLHGERRADGDAQLRDPLQILKHWRLAIKEAALGVRYLVAHAAVDAERIGIVGYSLGSFIATHVGSRDRAVRAIVVAAGGDLPENLPFGPIVRRIVDPIAAVKRMDGRPLLIAHGRNDRTMRPAQAQRLYDAAPEPKEIRWWDAGHYLPDAATDYACEWLVKHLDA